MTVIARRVASIPVRLASDTWVHIVGLLASTNAAARDELLRVTGIASSLITRETPKNSPIVAAGDGPRVRLYCVYGEQAIEGENVNEATLPRSPLESSTWSVSLPCPAHDLSWVQAALKPLSSRITARDMAEISLPEPQPDETTMAKASINLESFLRP